MKIISTSIFSAISAGTLSIAQSLDPTTRITNFSTMWAKLFQQYVVEKIQVVIKPKFLNLTSGSGQVNCFLSEDSSSPNALSLNREHAVLDLLPSAASDDKKSNCTLTWIPRSSEDLAFTAVTVSSNLIYLKLFGNVGDTGLNSADSTSQIMADLVYDIAFRYYF